MIRFLEFVIPALWWKIIGKKDPLIKKALWDKTLEEHNNYYLLKKNWKLSCVELYLDKPIQINLNGSASFTIEFSIIINRGLGHKAAFNFIVKETVEN